MTKPKRIYISGPMSGHPDLNFPAFNAAEQELTALGFEVVNPAKLNPPDASYDQCMKTDIREMLTCDCIALLPGWESSKGAHLELHVAHRVGMQVASVFEIMILFAEIKDAPPATTFIPGDRVFTGIST